MFEGREWCTEEQPVQRPKERSVPGMFEEHPGSHCSWRGLSREQDYVRGKGIGRLDHVESCRPL